MDTSSAYVKGTAQKLSAAAITFDRPHVIAVSIRAMDDVRRDELGTEPEKVASALLAGDPRTRRDMLWGMREKPAGWTVGKTEAIHWPKSARAWRLRMALREIHELAWQHASAEQVAGDLAAWTG